MAITKKCGQNTQNHHHKQVEAGSFYFLVEKSHKTAFFGYNSDIFCEKQI
jgi:hypothetical protein